MQGEFSRRISHQLPMYQSALGSPVIVSNHRLENINCIIDPAADMGGLYLGDIISTLKPDLLKQRKIDAVLSCMAEKVSLSVVVPSHKILPIQDTLQFPINHFFKDAPEWIDARRKQGCNVLVHCHAGVSRSATIVIAYLMTYRGWSPLQSLEYVRSRRERAKPNANFWQQLQDLHYKLGGDRSKVSDNSRKIEVQTLKIESKENMYHRYRTSEVTPPPSQKLQIRQQNEKWQVPRTPEQYKIVQHQPKTQIRKRKRIFELPQSDQHQYRRNNVVSSQPGLQSAFDSRKSAYSYIADSRQIGNGTPQSDFRENHSAIDYRVMSHEPVKVVPTNQPIRVSSPVNVQYLSPNQGYVSPFEVRRQFNRQ